MRILFVVNDSSFFISHRLPIAQGASKAGYEVHVAAPDNIKQDLIQSEGFCFHKFFLNRKGVFILQEFLSFLSIVKLFQDVKPDIVHLITIKPIVYGGIASFFRKIPSMVYAVTGLGYIFSSTDLKAKIIRTIMTPLLHVCFKHPNMKVIFQNHDDMELMVNVAGLKNTALIRGSGVDMDLFQPRQIPSDMPTVVLASRMLFDKGVKEFVEAAHLLLQAGLNAKFILVGDTDLGNPKAVPRKQLLEWQKEKGVEWWGYCDNMPDVLAQCSIFCLPSFYGEGVPKALIEAAASGLPIVTTNWPGCRDVVEDGVNGILVPVRNVDALSLALRKLIENPHLRRQMGSRGRAIAESQFSVERVVKETLSVYEGLVS
ncbi:Putative glycosyltransferase [Citrifermentans bremense]|uniref:Glycosyltransferase n=1 Tax=Citrifermentans bremense TaxID=60035 RepID=A0A6S6M7Q2_9BACT|nr:glycosyltransferase family 4 protein [Citrifermentans bremense]BCG47774.1 Putative glycosyltransferase [Citrifermentans bremense]